jgi:hypothetical protein
LWTKGDDDDRSDDHRHAIDEDRLLRSCLVLLGVITELERVPVFGLLRLPLHVRDAVEEV